MKASKALPLLLLALCPVVPHGVSAQTARGSHEVMQGIVGGLVGSMNAPGSGSQGVVLSGTGSWTSGEKFKDPLKVPHGASDFDVIVRVPEGTSNAKALEAWEQTQRQLRNAIHKQFPNPAEAAAIIAKTNVYPPSSS